MSDFTQPEDSSRFNNTKDIVNAICDYIANNVEKDFTQQQLADQFYFSEHYLRHLFKKETGISIGSYKMSKRIERAKCLLKTTGLKINDVSAACGFKSPSYFTKLFTKTVGVSPKTYRKAK